jgi:hypothetical protein
MWYETQARWFTALFAALGALFILVGLARLLYVRRRNYQPKDSALAAFPASYATAGLAPGQTLAVRRGVM